MHLPQCLPLGYLVSPPAKNVMRWGFSSDMYITQTKHWDLPLQIPLYNVWCNLELPPQWRLLQIIAMISFPRFCCNLDLAVCSLRFFHRCDPIFQIQVTGGPAL